METKTKVPPESRWSVFFLIAALVVAPAAYADNPYLSTWNNIYGAQNGNGAGCQVCHAASTQNLNPYGKAFCDQSGTVSQRIQAAAVENADSDADPTGSSNVAEINAGSQPGWTTTAVPTYQRGNCNATGNTENAPNGIGDLDPTPVGNQPPVADANGPYNGTAGVTLITFDGSASADPDGSIASYDWNFGDGNTGAGVSPTHTYAAPGNYTVSLTVTDDAGDTDTATSTANIVAAPQDPIADPNGPYNGFEGQPVTFDGSGSSDPDGGTINQYDWDFGDGNTGTGVSPTHTYAAAGTYTITLTVVDDEGAPDLASRLRSGQRA